MAIFHIATCEEHWFLRELLNGLLNWLPGWLAFSSRLLGRVFGSIFYFLLLSDHFHRLTIIHDCNNNFWIAIEKGVKLRKDHNKNWGMNACSPKCLLWVDSPLCKNIVIDSDQIYSLLRNLRVSLATTLSLNQWQEHSVRTICYMYLSSIPRWT